MRKQKDAGDFIHAMIIEPDDHEKRNRWEVVYSWYKSPRVNTILAIWNFKRKRFPDGRVNKYKA